MSQAGIVDFESSHPQVPTTFVANVGTAVPIANTLEIVGTIVAAHSIPLETTGSGNTITVVTQYSSAAGSSVGTNAGLASFSSTYFNVDSNGFVTLNGAVIGQTITGNTGGALSPVAGNWNIFGTSTAAGAIPVQTSGSGNTLTVQVQKSQAIASTNAANVGLAAFNSTYFTVDVNGFVSINGAAIGETITGNTGGALSPTAGNWNILGTSTAAGTTPVQTSGTGSTLTVQVQKSQAIASTNATNVGLAAFNSTYFTVDANGFVSLVASAVGGHFAVDASTAPGTNPVVPNGSGTVTITGGQVAAGTTTNVIQTNSLAANTYTIQIQRSQAVASSTVGDNGVSHFNSTYFTVDSNGFVSLNGAAVGETITGNVGGALSPTAGNWNILGTSTAAGTTPVQTSGSGNTLTMQVQKAQAIASTNANNVGLAAFNSTYFTVDSNGFVSFVASSEVAAFTVDANTAPGTNPVVPNGSGTVTITGGQVAAGTITNVLRTISLAANTYTIQIQRSQAVASSTVGDNGVSHFNSTYFTVDSNGFVSLNGSGVGETITGNVGGALSPTAGNWNIPGNNTANNGFASYSTGSGSTLTMNSYGTAKWVVNPTAGVGTHTTIQAAITAASSGDTVFITANSTPYTENLTLKTGVNLTAFNCDNSLNGTGNVIISGTCTLTTAGTVTISGVQLQTNSAALLAVTGTLNSIVNLINCYLNMTNNTGITYSSSGASSKINIFNCLGDLGTTGIGIFTHSGANMISIENTIISNSGSSSTASTCSSGKVAILNSFLSNPITFSGTGALSSCKYSEIDSSATNTTALTTVTGTTNNLDYTRLASGTSTPLSVGGTVNANALLLRHTNAVAITGAGTLNYTSIMQDITVGTISPGTTLGKGTVGMLGNTAPTSGYIGERITASTTQGAPVSLSNTTPATIASISLTAGIWDISIIAGFQGTVTGTLFEAGISANSASFVGTVGGDSQVATPTVSTAGSPVYLTIPAFRVNIASGSTPTYYLVVTQAFTIGTLTGFGRISAVRAA